MAHCKVKKITAVCDKWKRDNNSDEAMHQIKKIIELKESEMPPCTCNKPMEQTSCPMKPLQETSCPAKPMENSASCQSPGPMTINPFFNFMKNLRETTCFNKTAVEVSKEAGERWSKMSECEKAPYIVEAYKVSRKKYGPSMKREHSSGSTCEPRSKVRKMN